MAGNGWCVIVSARDHGRSAEFTEWLPGGDYHARFTRQRTRRRYPAVVEGNNLDGQSFYRAIFLPFPPGAFEFWTRYGLRESKFPAVHGDLTSKDARLITHQSFVDEQGIRRHQATWVRYEGALPLPAGPPFQQVEPLPGTPGAPGAGGSSGGGTPTPGGAGDGIAQVRTRLFGMIKLKERVNTRAAADLLGVTAAEIEKLLFDLAGEGRIEGRLEGEEFVITSNVDEFVETLDASFREWGERVGRHDGKAE